MITCPYNAGVHGASIHPDLNGHTRPRVILLPNRSKPPVMEALGDFRPWLEARAEIVLEFDASAIHELDITSVPEAHFGLVLGGDGTMLGQARRLVDLNLPLVGINFGKLGFLAEFSLSQLQEQWHTIVSGNCHVSERMMVEALVFATDAPKWGGSDHANPQWTHPVCTMIGLNEVVISHHNPGRLVEVSLAVDPRLTGDDAAVFAADGVMVSTPSGSTAYNLSAGGPIVSPGVNGLCVTAICPQSLAARPIVVHADSELWLAVRHAAEGALLMVDGQMTFALAVDQQVLVRRYARKLRLIHNPSLNYWSMLAHKMRWAVRPQLHSDVPDLSA